MQPRGTRSGLARGVARQALLNSTNRVMCFGLLADSRAEVFLYQSDIDDFLAGYGASAAIEKKEAPKFRDVSGTFKETRRGGDRTDRAQEE